MTELDALRSVNFDWAMRLADVWGRASPDVPELHKNVRAEFVRKLDDMRKNPSGGSPLGWVIVGAGGTGKTHLLGTFRREAAARKCGFVLVDMTDVRNFWETVLQGFLDSLQQSFEDEVYQYDWVLRNIIERLKPNKPVAQIVRSLAMRKSEDLQCAIPKVLSTLGKVYPREALKYQNVVRALICLNSADLSISSLGMTWLQGQALEDEDRKPLGFTTPAEKPSKIVEALSWIMSLGGPMVLAFDQLDPIVTQLHYRKQGNPSTAEQAASASIIVEIGGGLAALRDLTRNTLTVVSCVESTWETLGGTVLKTSVDRFEPPRRLASVGNEAVALLLVRGRLGSVFQDAGFEASYPTYPFREGSFTDLRNDSPREVLKKCELHRQECIRLGAVTELTSFRQASPNGEPVRPPPDRLTHLDRAFSEHFARAAPTELLAERYEDERLAPLLRSALECLLHETELPANVHSVVDTEFTGGATTRPLHARLRLIFIDENEREEHFCVRALQLTNARAYQARLKAAMTQAGIDRALPFRRLTVVRTGPIPGGAETQRLTETFRNSGGLFVKPTEEEIRTIHAVHELKGKGDPDFETWLKARKPVSKLRLIREIAPIETIAPRAPHISGFPPFGGGTEGGSGANRLEPEVTPPNPPFARGGVLLYALKPESDTARTPLKSDPHTHEVGPPGPEPESRHEPEAPVAAHLPIGRRLIANRPGEPIGMALKLLEKHTIVLAGAGSGKTVLLKRLIEEALILGVPSIVIDSANDLAALDEEWPTPPAEWQDGDRLKADLYHRRRDVVLWTPGKESGNPFSFEPLPDLAPLIDDKDELETAVLMVREALAAVVAPGNSPASQHKQGILSKALRFLAHHGGGKLDELIDLLTDLPPDAGLGVANEAKLAQQIADSLRAQRETNPMLRSSGATLDPAVLLGDDAHANRTRTSVISFAGLPGIEAQRTFLNQLAMTLFSWIRKHPAPAARALRGLLVIDEAKDFVPSQKASVCRESLVRLVAQARKYHFGLIFATQNPKDIDNRIVANCSTHFYGKLNSPASIDTVRELIRQKGGSGEDLPRLSEGQFYVHNADAQMSTPVKVLVPLCLSRHPRDPLDEAAVLGKALASRQRAGGTS